MTYVARPRGVRGRVARWAAAASGFPRRRATTANPARSNIESVPWYAFADGIRPSDVDRVGLERRGAVVPRVVDGRRQKLPCDAPSAGRRATTKQTIDQTGVSSSGARTLEWVSRS